MSCATSLLWGPFSRPMRNWTRPEVLCRTDAAWAYVTPTIQWDNLVVDLNSPVSGSSSAIRDCFDEDAQLLQSGIGSDAHADDAQTNPSDPLINSTGKMSIFSTRFSSS